MPRELEQQLDGIVHYLQAAGLASLCRDGVEADDWIAALARHAAEQVPVVIASSDKDFMQLVSPRIGLMNPNDKAERIWKADDVRMRTGIAPSQVVDWLSLVGDSVDHIPGVPGIGPKTAAELLQQLGSVDGIYSRLSEVKSERLRASLQGAGEIVRRNQRLIRLREEQPSVPIEELALRAPDASRLRELYDTWGFKTLLAQLSGPPLRQGALL